MTLTDRQRRAVEAPGSVAVLAGAGTGKTHLLSHRYLQHLSRGLNPLQIVVTTYTDAAATELRSRIRTAIRNNQPSEDELLAQVEIAPISTMHGLCQQICREYPTESELPAGFRIIDEIDAILWFERNYPAVLSQLPAHLLRHIHYSQFKNVLRQLLTDPYLAETSLRVDRITRITRLEAASKELVQETNRLVKENLTRLRSISSAPLGPSARTAWAHYTEMAERFLQADDHETRRAALAAMAPTMRISSTSDTDPAAYATLGDSMRKLRSLARTELNDGILTMDWGEADDLLEEQLPAVRQALSIVEPALRRRRQAERIATFDDLELGALRALDHEHVQTELRQRWRAFLIDEFQDTNPVQLKLIEKLSGLGSTDAATLTTVGDTKQSIYGFRRAAPQLSLELADRLPDTVQLDLNFRTHDALLQQLNQLFDPLLGDLHQPLTGHRTDQPAPGPHLQLLRLDSKQIVRRAEARLLANLVKDQLQEGVPVWDKNKRSYRPVQLQDYAVLVRTQNSLPDLLAAFAEAGVPAVHTGADDLLGTPEAQDASCLLEFLNNPLDDLMLLSVLRSPFFAISDHSLQLLAQQRQPGQTWWTLLRSEPLADTRRAEAVLQQLLSAADQYGPVRLLQLADRLTGYSAVLAGLSDSRRRLADWQGFLDLLLRFEAAGNGLVAAVRQLRDLRQHGLDLPRPQLEAGDAVSFMTIHKSKGLEWPVVIVADLTSRGSGRLPAVLLDADIGCAINRPGDEPPSLAWRLLLRRSKERAQLEDRRILYVAATRAADHLILSGSSQDSSLRSTLTPAIEQSGLPESVLPVDEDAMAPWGAAAADPATAPIRQLPVLTGPVAAQLRQLPVTALSYYAACPRRFEYRHVLGHPGSQPEFSPGEDSDGTAVAGAAWRVGDLTHIALENQITELALLHSHDPSLPQQHVREALQLANVFRQSKEFEPARRLLEGAHELEAPVETELAGLTFSGRVDVLTGDALLDYKTDQHPDPDRHALQLALYAHATGVRQALLAYLRRERLVIFGRERLSSALELAESLAKRMRSADYVATPGPEMCRICEYSSICDAAWNASDSATD